MANNPKYHLGPTYLYSGPILLPLSSILKRILLLKVYTSSRFVHSSQYNIKISKITVLATPMTLLPKISLSPGI